MKPGAIGYAQRHLDGRFAHMGYAGNPLAMVEPANRYWSNKDGPEEMIHYGRNGYQYPKPCN